jgi:8-oxo-dGTP diphosphatase
MWNGTAFSGTKIAILCGKQIVAYLRDDKAGIPFPGMWDLPGGGRETDEGPIECGLREVSEEFGLMLDAADVFVVERHQSSIGGLDGYFCAIRIEESDLDRVKFGEEGQRWELMRAVDFVNHEGAVPHLRKRLRELMERGLV